jgi:hypothetical protein
MPSDDHRFEVLPQGQALDQYEDNRARIFATHGWCCHGYISGWFIVGLVALCYCDKKDSEGHPTGRLCQELAYELIVVRID